MNTILAMVFAFLLVIMVFGYVKFDIATLQEYKRNQEFKEKLLNKRGCYLVVLWWYDKKDFTHGTTSGHDALSAVCSMIDFISKKTGKKPNKDYAIVNVKKIN